MTKSDELFVAYEPWHVDLARSHAAHGATIVCLDFWVERELTKKNIPFVSVRDFVDAETGAEEWWLLAQDVAREWYRVPAMQFFEHDGIRIFEVIEPIMELYLSRLFYYVRIFVALKKAYPGARFSIPTLVVSDALTEGCLVSFERRTVVDAARMVGVESVVQSTSIAPRKQVSIQAIGKSLFVWLYTVLIRFVPRRSLKLYASEYWSNIGPVITQMKDAELILMESGELKHIPWRQLLSHRVRTRHPNDAIRRVDRDTATRISEEYKEQWEAAKGEVAAYLKRARGELDWSPVLEACAYLVAYAPRVVNDIDSLRRIVKEEKPDVVLQTASVGLRQSYFFILARIAAQLKIPSVELQHAAAYADPRSVYARIETDYLASYGAYTNSLLERIGYARHRLVPIGSPRFDQLLSGRVSAREQGRQLFTQLGLAVERPVLLVAMPFSDSRVSVVAFDSYDMRDLCMAVRSLQHTSPEVQVLFKFRSSHQARAMRAYLQELFPANSAIAVDEDFFALLCASDVAMCGYSTVIYEALLAQKPLVLFPWRTFDTYNAEAYVPAAPFLHTAEEAVAVLAHIFADPSYRAELLSRQQQFLTGYRFDGVSSARIAAFLRELPKLGKK